MNLLTRLLALGTLLLAPAIFADGFEGKVSLQMTSGKGKTMPIDYTIKGSRVRIDMNAEGHSVASIMDAEKKEMIMLMPEQQMFMVMPMKQVMDKAVASAEASGQTVEKTGRTETILGYKCDEYVAKGKDGTTEVWIAEGLGSFMGLGGGGPMGGPGGRGKAAGGGWETAFKGKPGFPLRVITHSTSGKDTFKMEATKIEKGGVSDADFTPPEGYQKFSMPDMGGMNPFGKG